MTFWAFSALFNALTSGFLGVLVYSKDRRNEKNFSYGLFCSTLCLWSVSYFLWQISIERNLAFIWCQILMMFAVFIPITYLHYVYSFLDVMKIYRFRIYSSYVLGGLLAFFCFNSYFIKGVSSKLFFKFWPDAGPYYFVLLIIWSFYIGLALSKLLQALKHTNREQIRNQIRYILFATIIGSLGGLTNFPLWFKIEVLPVGNILTSFYVSVIAYAIVKYRLMDIKLAITRVSIFVIVYSLVLGVPFWVGIRYLGVGSWLFPVTLMGLFATLGPFIYLYIQRRAENRLLQEQRSYQATLRQASAGMGRIKDLGKLLNMIVYVLTRTVRLEHCVIYIQDKAKRDFLLGAFKNRSTHAVFPELIAQTSALIIFLEKNRNPIIYEEIKQKSFDYHDPQLVLIEQAMQNLQTALIVPIYIDNHLIAFVGMGKKESGKLYTEDDLAVFTILSNQAALAIENAEFYEDMRVAQQQLFQAEKMATIGTMADGLSHQINNRFHALGFIAGDALDTIRMNKNLEMSDKLKEMMAELEKAFTRVQENVTQGGEVVQGLLKYTRKGDAGFSPTDVDAVITTSYEMAQFKIKNNQMSLVRSYDKNVLPKVKGNSAQLQEVFFNLIDNAYDAMMQRKNEVQEEGYHPTLTIYAQPEGDYLHMFFVDNGIGVKEEDLKKLFTPFFTTKLSSKKGTGLGLYVIKKIIEENHKGKVEFISQYLVGTKMKIKLPLTIQND